MAERVEEIRARLAALPEGFVLGVEGSYFDCRRLVANMWGEAEEEGDAGPCDPCAPELLAFRDHALSDFACLLSTLDAANAALAEEREAHDATKRALADAVRERDAARSGGEYQQRRLEWYRERAEKAESSLRAHAAKEPSR